VKLLKLIYEIPLSVSSWLFFHTMKFVLGRLYTFALSRMTFEAQEWKPFSAETISRPFVLPIIATKGPRWNTHALLFTAGPLEVRETLSIDASAASASAASWSIVLYANPGYRTAASIESFKVAEGGQWREFKLAPGKYSINARYYGWGKAPVAPEVRVDDATVVPSKPLPPDSNDVYRDLYRRGSWFYAALHYYVFHMLRFRRWLPASFVRREYLPVGDPGTIFRYGFIRAGERLDVAARPELLEGYDVYLTVYNRSSFPVASEQIRDALVSTPPATVDGFYLFRIRRKPSIILEYREEWLKIQTATPSQPLYRSVSVAR
jgi:hypothetical protein